VVHADVQVCETAPKGFRQFLSASAAYLARFFAVAAQCQNTHASGSYRAGLARSVPNSNESPCADFSGTSVIVPLSSGWSHMAHFRHSTCERWKKHGGRVLREEPFYRGVEVYGGNAVAYFVTPDLFVWWEGAQCYGSGGPIFASWRARLSPGAFCCSCVREGAVSCSFGQNSHRTQDRPFQPQGLVPAVRLSMRDYSRRAGGHGISWIV